MNNQTVDIKSVADIVTAIAHYSDMITYFQQISFRKDCEMRERLQQLLVNFNSDKDFWKSPISEMWHNIELHVSQQVWGSTSCGWGGMGGSMMTKSMNVIVYNLHIKHAFVYWGGELAYICPIDEIKEGFIVPSLRDVKNAIYKNIRK